MWVGGWTYAGITYPATLRLDYTDPISGVMEIEGWCTAIWSESVRVDRYTRLVRAHITSGHCLDVTWEVTLGLDGRGSVSGFDIFDPKTTFRFTPGW